MTPWELAKNGSEFGHQTALFAWANCAARYGFIYANDERSYHADHRRSMIVDNIPIIPVPALSRLFAVHNQGHGDAIRGARAKAEGVKAGVPDLMLPVPVFENGGAWICGLWIELKKPKVGKVADKQSEWIEYLNNVGYRAVTCYGWEAARDELIAYLRLL
jgi:hypothetical protein